MRSIVRIVEAAGPGCLVLLDELGAGTDPTEGSALAQALLDHFIAAGALVAATTHYAELKAYAHNVAQAENASVEFDIETLSPTYRLQIGLPGTSQAFAIAERLGLAPALVDDARSRLGEAQAEFEQTLASIREAQLTTEEALARATESEQRARAARREAEEERLRARRERETAMADARLEAERALAEVQEEISAARELLERQTLTDGRLDESAASLSEAAAALKEAQVAAPPPMPPDVEVGSTVRSRDGWQGTVEAIDGGVATLAAGPMRVKVPTEELQVLAAVAPPLPGETIRPQAHRVIPSSLDLRGARVEEALDMLESYIDGASVAGASRVTIIHGHGSGALRDALRSRLSGHPLVKSWRAGERGEGGDGATIVEL
jgi:DNA mismatch repair protein MutS2